MIVLKCIGGFFLGAIAGGFFGAVGGLVLGVVSFAWSEDMFNTVFSLSIGLGAMAGAIRCTLLPIMEESDRKAYLAKEERRRKRSEIEDIEYRKNIWQVYLIQQ